jgi:predicted membrane protein
VDDAKEKRTLILAYFVMSVVFGSISGATYCFFLFTTPNPFTPFMVLAGGFFLLMFVIVICSLFVMFISAAVLFTPALIVVIHRRQSARERRQLLKLEDEFIKEMSDLEKSFFYRSVPDRFHWLKNQLEKIKTRLAELR